VRLALAETQIIAETKEFLEKVTPMGVTNNFLKQGVSLDTLGSHGNKSVQRSTTTILVKNIPYSTDEKMLRKTFEKFGGLARVFPSTKYAYTIGRFASC
jgi:multiple RNA-binding domain-containing protein 1